MKSKRSPPKNNVPNNNPNVNKDNENLCITDLLDRVDPDLSKVLWDPEIVRKNFDDVRASIEPIIEPFEICKNVENELPLIKTQINFIVPSFLRKTKEKTFIDIKETISTYKSTYEKQAREINQFIELTRNQLTSLNTPLSTVREEIMRYAKEFEESMNNIAIPLKNKLDGLNPINEKNIKKDLLPFFKREKARIITEIDSFGKEAKAYHEKYSSINQENIKLIQNFVKIFNDLVKPTKDCAALMKKGIKEFEGSSSLFKDSKNLEKMTKALDKILAFTKTIHQNFESIKSISQSISIDDKKLLGLNNDKNFDKLITEMKKECQVLQKKSETIANKINEIRKKYGKQEINMKKMQMKEPNNVNDIKSNIMKAKEDMDKVNDKIIENVKQIEGFESLIKSVGLDIVFIMDITSSMDEYLGQAKNGIIKMIQVIKKSCPSADVSVGFVGYRDFGDLDLGKEYVDIELTQDFKGITESLENVVADGGGDVPEDLAGAFEMALNKNWQGFSRFAILVTDAPCHGEKYHHLKGDLADNFPNGDKNGRDIEKQIAEFAKKQISVYCLRISELTDIMFDLFKNIYDQNKPEGSRSNFVVENSVNIFDIVTKRAIELYRNKRHLYEEEKKNEKK